MNILMLNHNVGWSGGTFYRAYHYARYLVRAGHSVTLLTLSAKNRFGFEREESQGVRIIYTPDLLSGIGRTGWDPWDVLNRLYWLRGTQWDIVHAWDCRPVVILPALFACSRTFKRPKLVIDWCDWWGRGGTQQERPGGLARFFYNPVETYFEEAFRTKADGTTVISEALYERSIALKVPRDSIKLLPQGCDIEEVFPDRNEARARLNISAAQRIILSVGALTSSESQLFFATIEKLLLVRPDCTVVMIGKNRFEIPEHIRSQSRFCAVGFISDSSLRDYVAACCALLVPLTDTLASRARWPSKANPFLAAGRVVVTSGVGDLAKLLRRECAGIVTRCDPSDIVENIVRLFDNPEMQKTYETRARSIAEDVLAWPVLAHSVEAFYDSLLMR